MMAGIEPDQFRQDDEWLQKKWRPITAVVYLVICVFDFMLFPIFWSAFLMFSETADVTIAWDPLTLKGAGLFHLAFGAILGVSAFTRGQEKVQRLRRPSYSEYTYSDEEDYYEDEPQRRSPRFDPPRTRR
jgi:hypothetical protein